MSRNAHRTLAVLTTACGLLALGATTAHADGADGADAPGAARPGSVLQPVLSGAIESVQDAVPAVPEDGRIEVPSLAPGVPSIGVLPLSVPELPVTPGLPRIPGVPTIPGNPADIPGQLPLP